ncbi:MAG: shikimate dehydrogenase [Chitinispirillaceae bacterium]|nr:shikimate dehydrogenase [Chitinispirillaceae bacterium]
MANYKEELVGVLGHPVSENPTVVMQEAAFGHLDLHWRYLTIEVLPENLGKAIDGLRAMQFKGINLTVPHKVAVLPFLDEIAPDAALMGAVNTVVNAGGKLRGENTDGKGFMRSLTHDAGFDPKGKRAVILGAGGAARSIAVELALAGIAEIVLVNRSRERGVILRDLITGKTAAACRFEHWQGTFNIPAGIDLLVNATSVGLAPGSDEKPDLDYATIGRAMVVCDVIPAPVTPFLSLAKEQGARTVDGLGMLVYQGAIGFKLWTGLDAPVAVMHEALKQAFGA